ncbi:MAG: anhydro-N-acetylmuramic acid kinase [Pseudomonadota bacterium]
MSNNLFIGAISGTSMDGLDVSILDICKKSRENYAFNSIFFKTYKYPDALNAELKQLVFTKEFELKDFCELQYKMGKFFAESILKAVKASGINKQDIKAIGSHGQNIYHLPSSISDEPYSFQIGHPSIIAGLTDITTVSDFRMADIIAHGEGAPLAPIFHYHFFKKFKKSFIVLNIGGIANITVIDYSKEKIKVSGFDTGPGNTLIDRAMNRLFKLPYDKNGQIAKKGKVDYSIIKKLLKNDYFQKNNPKSSGLEKFDDKYLKSIIRKLRAKRANKNDIISSLTALTAESISLSLNKHLRKNMDTVVLCGGGPKNSTMISFLKNLHPDLSFINSDKFGISIDEMEADLFAFLAYLSINGHRVNLKTVTGSKKEICLGVIAPGGNYRSVYLSH